MSTSTIYDLRLRYMLDDGTSKGLGKMDRRLRSTSDSAGMLTSTLKRAAAAAVAFVGIRAAGRALIGYNKSLEDARTNIAGLIMATTGSQWTESIGAASAMMKELQDRSAKSTATTQEMTQFLNEVTQPLLAAGLHVSKLAEFTADAVIAAKAFGDESIAAMDIQQALSQGVQIRDRFSKKLLNTVRLTREEFNKMNTAQRLTVLKSAVSSTVIKKLGAEQATTFSGVWSTFQDNMQRTLGTAGKGLFDSIRRELLEVTAWVAKNQTRVKDIARTVGTHLVTGFKTIKSVVSFFVDHADTLIMVAKTWAGLKLGRMAGGLLGGGMTGGGGLLGRMGGGLLAKGMDKTGIRVASFGAKLVTAGGFLTKFLGPVGLAAGALMAIYDWWTSVDPSTKTKRIEASEATSGILAVQKKITPLLEERLGQLGVEALAQKEESQIFVNGRRRYVPEEDKPKQLAPGTADAGFIGAMRAFTQRDIRGDRMGRKQFPAKESTELTQLAMKLNRDKINALTETLAPAQRALAQWAMKVNLVNEDLSGFKWKVLGEQNNKLNKQLGLSIVEWEKVVKALGIMERQIKGGGLSLSDLLSPGKKDGAFSKIRTPEAVGEGKAAKVNVTIQRIEVRSEDPDRFVFQMQSAVAKLARNPSQSGLAQRIAG